MAAPGLAMVAISPRAWEATVAATMPRFYLDLERTATTRRTARRRGLPRSACCSRSTRALGSWRRGPGRRVRASRGMRGGDACGSRAWASSSSPTTPSHPGRSPRRASPMASTGRRSTATSSVTGLVLAGGQGQSHRQDLPGRAPGQRDPRGDPRRDRARSRPASVRHGRSVAARGGRRGRAAARGRLSSARRGRDEPRPRVGCGSSSPRPSPARAWRRCGRDHEVDVRVGLSRAELLRDPPGLRRAAGAEPGPGGRGARSRPAPRLQVIGRAGVGVDNVDLDGGDRMPASSWSTHRPGNTIAAAEHTLALALRRSPAGSPAADASMRRGEWKRAQFTGTELRGKTLGIVGLGKIGHGGRGCGPGRWR